MIHWESLPENDKQRILAAIDRLAKGNNNVVNQLERLASIKENEPIKWNLGLKALKIS